MLPVQDVGTEAKTWGPAPACPCIIPTTPQSSWGEGSGRRWQRTQRTGAVITKSLQKAFLDPGDHLTNRTAQPVCRHKRPVRTGGGQGAKGIHDRTTAGKCSLFSNIGQGRSPQQEDTQEEGRERTVGAQNSGKEDSQGFEEAERVKW